MTDMIAAREVADLRSALAEARDELARAKFHADEFHQGDEDMEAVVLAMWDSITGHRQRAEEWRAGVEAANRISQRERERAERAEAALRETRRAIFWSRSWTKAAELWEYGTEGRYLRALHEVRAHRRLRDALAAPQPKETQP